MAMPITRATKSGVKGSFRAGWLAGWLSVLGLLQSGHPSASSSYRAETRKAGSEARRAAMCLAILAVSWLDQPPRGAVPAIPTRAPVWAVLLLLHQDWLSVWVLFLVAAVSCLVGSASSGCAERVDVARLCSWNADVRRIFTADVRHAAEGRCTPGTAGVSRSALRCPAGQKVGRWSCSCLEALRASCQPSLGVRE